jgi:predicted enzyme related to lactoylglutathione lyase
MAHRHFPFVVLEIEAENLQRAGAFYASVFGWSFSDSPIEHGTLEADLGADHDTMVRVHLRVRHPLDGPLAPAARSDGHALCVCDLEPILARLVAAGGQLIAGPVEIPGVGRRLFLRDTEGNEVAILEPSHESH